jgi:hypothetical protein
MTPMTDKDLFSAYTQRHITMLLLYGLLILVVGIIVASYLPWKADQAMLSLATPLITGIYGLASGAVGFWIAKQRPLSPPDPATTTTDTHIRTTPAPQIVPAGSALVPAPAAPVALVPVADVVAAAPAAAAAAVLYDAHVVYPVNTRVTYEGNDYVSILPVIAGILPTNTMYWTPAAPLVKPSTTEIPK